ncbi:hypothetical protein, partial [Vibrio parahaemolyticus]|uniref:hypothetical protein n=1 Tax=Vibrio parahaemolyticus TaxID=670 RepID=UPI001C5F99C9
VSPFFHITLPLFIDENDLTLEVIFVKNNSCLHNAFSSQQVTTMSRSEMVRVFTSRTPFLLSKTKA